MRVLGGQLLATAYMAHHRTAARTLIAGSPSSGASSGRAFCRLCNVVGQNGGWGAGAWTGSCAQGLLYALIGMQRTLLWCGLRAPAGVVPCLAPTPAAHPPCCASPPTHAHPHQKNHLQHGLGVRVADQQPQPFHSRRAHADAGLVEGQLACGGTDGHGRGPHARRAQPLTHTRTGQGKKPLWWRP